MKAPSLLFEFKECSPMPKRRKPADDYDSPWKDALQRYLRHFLVFYFPDIAADIDWSRRYESLDKEFQQIVRRAKVGKRLADKLFKVWLRDGTERWLLIHIEVQGDYEADFPNRIFDYNVAVRQMYNQPVISLAVLCDDRPNWRPTSFTYGAWGCQMELTFRIAKLLDANDVDLEASSNPFAMVTLAHKKSLETRDKPDSRRQWKVRLVRELLRGNWSKDDVRQLFRLIDWIMTLPEELEAGFRADLESIEKENNVEYLSSIERHGFKKGLEQGREKGKGEGLLEGIALLLDSKFGAEGGKVLRKVRKLDDLAELRNFARFLKNAETIEEVRDYLK